MKSINEERKLEISKFTYLNYMHIAFLSVHNILLTSRPYHKIPFSGKKKKRFMIQRERNGERGGGGGRGKGKEGGDL